MLPRLHGYVIPVTFRALWRGETPLNDTLPPEGNAYTRTLKRAAATVGGVEALAAMLHVSPADMARWISGDGRPPQDIFLAALDIVSGGLKG